MSNAEQIEVTVPQRSRARVARGLGIGGTFGFLGGMIIGSVAGVLWTDTGTGITRSEAQAQMIDAQTDLAEAQGGMRGVERKIGEPCVRALAHYRADDALGGTDEKIVMADMLVEPDHPCGATQSAVRYTTTSFLQADLDLSNANGSVEAAQHDVANAIDDSDLDLAAKITWAGAAVGTGLGLLVAREVMSANDQRLITAAG